MRGEKEIQTAGEHHLARVFKRWAELNATYSEETGQASYVYREEANVSLMCAAAWQMNKMYALSEFHISREVDGKKATGFTDLSIIDAESDEEFYLEAKATWPIIQSSKSKPKIPIDTALRSSRDQLRRILDTENTGDDEYQIKRQALIFIIPNILIISTRDLEYWNLRPSAIIDEVCSEEPVLWASYFRRSQRKESPKDPAEKYYRPGVIAALYDFE